MNPYLLFVQGNLTYILSFAVVALSFFCLGLLIRPRSHILVQHESAPRPERTSWDALDPYTIGYVHGSGGARHALRIPESMLRELEELAALLEKAAPLLLTVAMRHALLGILHSMARHYDDPYWFSQMETKIHNARNNMQLGACAGAMLRYAYDHR
ncbi:MAG TPA: hypothetical protein VGG48_08105 [Rhizomicrobium sp.]|jgi:hypothetical protein